MTHDDLTTGLARNSRKAANALAVLGRSERDQALLALADALHAARADILRANQNDCEAAQDIEPALFNRLKLSESKLNEAIQGIRDLVALPDPLGKVLQHRRLDDGLVLRQVSCPLGVIGVIFEARPEVLIQISALAIKSGNGVILKGGKEATQSCLAIMKVLQEALAASRVPVDTVQLLTSRSEVDSLLKQHQYIDLIIPRGSNDLVRYIQNNTRIPVIGHADGICHLFVDASADVDMAVAIAVDAKTQYPSGCNAIETLLVEQSIAPRFLERAIPALQAKGVQLRVDAAIGALYDDLPRATEEDWGTEYSALILSMKRVDSLDEAINHINTYGSRHTDAIVTENAEHARQFFEQVDAANVFHNCSTRFADGFRYGFGAEVGISTQKMPPRGPVGLDGLVTYKYLLSGHGDIVASYSGPDAKSFKHEDIQ